MQFANYVSYFSLLLVVLQIINQLISLFTPIKSTFLTNKFFSWKEVDRFIDKLAKQIKDSNIEYGLICGTGRGGGILASLLSYKLNLVPVLVLDRKYIIDDINNNRTCIFIEKSVVIDDDFKDILGKPVLLITPQSDPGVTLNVFREQLRQSGFTGSIDKCAILSSVRTLDVDLKYTLYRYHPDTKCRHFPWEKKNPDLMEHPIHRN